MIKRSYTFEPFVLKAKRALTALQKPFLASTLSLTHQSDLYHDKLFTVIPKDLPLNQGILPEDQRFSKKYVFLWDNYRDLVKFDEGQWKKVSVLLPHNIKFNELTRIPADGYGLPFIPNTWQIEEYTSQPQYQE
jgi:hypothetical protein